MFKIRQLHQIELTSRCNLRCRYCPNPHLGRPKVDMDEDTFLAALTWAAEFAWRGDQREFNLAGIGESTLHPDLVRFAHLAHEELPAWCQLVLTTNGVLMNEALARDLAPTGIRVFVSLHRPEVAGPAVEACKKYGILAGVSADPSVAAINWAGQVKWHVSAPRRECFWVKQGRGFVLADGRISRCCMDATGEGVIGTVFDDVPNLQTSPYSLCRNCDQDVGVPFPEQ